MISVLLPTYNSCETIGRSIRSILEQTFTAFELLILDDGSTDATSEIVHSFNDNRIRYLLFPHRGISQTLNDGIRSSIYEIIARMDAGDISLPCRFEKQLYSLKKNTDNTIVSCQYAMFENRSIQYIVSGSSNPDVTKKRLALHPDFPHPGVMYYKKFIAENGMYHDVPLEDYQLWLRIKDIAEFVIYEKPLLLVEHSGKSLTNNNVVQRYQDHYRIQEPYFRNLANEFNISSASEELIIRGWREYFYGQKAQARKYWKMLRKGIVVHPNILLAWLFTYFPEELFVSFKENRMKQRIRYYCTYFWNDSRMLRNQLKRCL